jgi:16S rRNA G966 N2-methylase RsmD
MEFQICKNSKAGEMVIDPFCGSGSVGLEAILRGRNFIGFDLNPFAIRLSESTLSPEFDIAKFEEHLKIIIDTTKYEIMRLYQHDTKYVLYTIPGEGNKESYNIVYCDYEFRRIGDVYDPSLVVDFGLTTKGSPNVPDSNFPSKFYKDRFSYKGVKKVSDLFSTRNLKALEILRDAISKLPIDSQPDFRLILTNTLLHVSKLKSEKIRPLGVNNYWIPDDYIEENVFWRFVDRAKQYQIAKIEISNRFNDLPQPDIGSYELRQTSSIPMESIDSESVDYILTDPPYGDVIQYSELSFVWNVWLEDIQDPTFELIVNPVQGKNESYFLEQLSFFLADCFRVLKPSRSMTLCFQNKDPKIWFEVAQIARNVGFTLKDIETFDFLGSTFNKNWSKKSPKVDLYVTLSKSIDVEAMEAESSEFVDLLKIYSGDSHFTELSQVHDAYSKLIALGISQIFKGYRILDFTKRDLEEFLSSESEGSSNNAEYNQTELF